MLTTKYGKNIKKHYTEIMRFHILETSEPKKFLKELIKMKIKSIIINEIRQLDIGFSII